MIYEYTNLRNIIARLKLGMDNNISLGDIIEWTGQGIDRICDDYVLLDNSVVFLAVINHKVKLIPGINNIQQIAKYNYNGSITTLLDKNANDKGVCPKVIYDKVVEEYPDKKPSCYCNGLNDVPTIDYNLRYFELGNLAGSYWMDSTYCKNNFEPVYLTQNTMFNSICVNNNVEQIKTSRHEYSISNGVLTTTFKEGIVALSVYRLMLGEDGYPLIPKSEYIESALEYYVKWKYHESRLENDSSSKSRFALSYNKEMYEANLYDARLQFRTRGLIDQLENLKESNKSLLPNDFTYQNFFSNLHLNYD